MSLGVAIPTYSKHYPFLQSLLENIAASEVKPDMIAVSCSSMIVADRAQLSIQGIPVLIDYTTKTRNPSENRNCAAALLNTDLISFVDGDDLVHPQRIGFLKTAFADHPEIEAIYHSYESGPVSCRTDPFLPVGSPGLVRTFARKPYSHLNPYNVGLYIENDPSSEIHHAHVTVRRSLFDRFKFDETPQFKYSEDSRYATTLFTNGVSLGYLASPLTRYISGTR